MGNTVLKPILLIFLAFVILFVLLTLGTEKLSSIFPHSGAKAVLILPEDVDLGSLDPGSEQFITFRLKNLSGKDIDLVGETSGCSCVFIEHLPITVHPQETAEVNVRIKIPKYRSIYSQDIEFIVATDKRIQSHCVHVSAIITNPLPLPFENEMDSADGNTDKHELHADESINPIEKTEVSL